MCTFHLTMERADAVRGLARSVRPVLERFECVDPVPESWLHLTMNGLGFADEVPDDRLEAIADEVFALWSSLDDPVLRFTHLFVGLEGAMLVAERSMIPMSFDVMKIFQAQGFKLKELIIKEQHNCKATGYWKTNSIKYNFLLIAHEYLFVFKK